jgi:S1-C subfamily serine protease
MRILDGRGLISLVIVALLSGLIGGTVALWAVTSWSPARVALLGAATSGAATSGAATSGAATSGIATSGTATLPPTLVPATPTSPPTASPTLAPSPTATETPTPTPTAAPTPTPTALAAYNVTNLADLVEKVNPSVVTIFVIRGRSSKDAKQPNEIVSGSGVIIDPRGYILTNYHVVEQAETLLVTYGGEKLPALYVNGDAKSDLALLKLVRRKNYAPLPWGDSEALRLGESVMAIGSPLGALTNSVTTGVISGLGRAVPLEDNSMTGGLIQTDAAINRGNSGGALINMRGELVGIVTLTLRSTDPEAGRDVQGVGFAIASARARTLVDQWIAENNP